MTRFDGFSTDRYSEDIRFFEQRLPEVRAELEGLSSDPATLDGRVFAVHWFVLDHVSLLMLRYSRGDALAEMRPAVASAVGAHVFAAQTLDAWRRRHGESTEITGYGVLGLKDHLHEVARLLAFALALGLPEPDVREFVISVRQRRVSRFWDLLVGGSGLETPEPIAAAEAMPALYAPLSAAVERSPAERPAALLEYLKTWRKRIRPFPWSTAEKDHGGAAGHGLWCFEVACAVMVFEIPDDDLRKHKDYPVDVVDAFRRGGTTLSRRLTRDSSVLPVRPLPESSDARSSLLPGETGATADTFLVLVTNGDADAVGALVEKWRNVAAEHCAVADVFDELARRGHAIRVDVRDSAEAAAAAGELARRRGLPEYLSDVENGDVASELRAFARWLQPHGYALLEVDTDSDEVVAFVVRLDQVARAIANAKLSRLAVERVGTR